jgi:hypothetical protein
VTFELPDPEALEAAYEVAREAEKRVNAGKPEVSLTVREDKPVVVVTIRPAHPIPNGDGTFTSRIVSELSPRDALHFAAELTKAVMVAYPTEAP